MPRASSLLCLPAALVLAAAAPAVELPVIVNGTQVVQANTQPSNPPAPPKMQLPVIYNYPSAAMPPADQKADGKLPVIVNRPGAPPAANAAPVRVAVTYVVPTYTNYMTPVAYNGYGNGGMYSADVGMGYGYSAPYGGGYGSAFGAYAIPAYDTFGPWGYGLYPPLVEVLDTGVRANVGRLVSMPSVRSPVYGHVMGVYYR
jgi:hypothetical protein